MTTGIILQARTGSSRLPRKVLKKIGGLTILEHDIVRLQQVVGVDSVIVATTTNEQDNEIVEICNNLGIKVYRGSECNVLSRYYEAAKFFSLQNIIRITSDCPLIDPIIISDMMAVYNTSNYDLVTNVGLKPWMRTFPRGFDAEIFSFCFLEKAYNNAKKEYQIEHVTPYIYETCENIYYYLNDKDFSNIRLTLDTEDDLKMIDSIYNYLYHGSHNFYFKEILDLLDEHPELLLINSNIQQKRINNYE